VASFSVVTVWTSRCWAPSWTSRWIRQRVSSAVATIRARDALSSARLSALAIAAATSSANWARRSSVPAGSGACREATAMTPHTRLATVTGAPTDARMPIRRARSASAPSMPS
jgi:hypothetical protein